MMRFLLAGFLGAGLGGCASAPGQSGGGASPPDEGVVRVQGQLTGEGVECRAMRADDGTLYTLLGNLEGFKTGERVVVEGTRVQISFCMQGVTLQVKQITRRQ